MTIYKDEPRRGLALLSAIIKLVVAGCCQRAGASFRKLGPAVSLMPLVFMFVFFGSAFEARAAIALVQSATGVTPNSTSVTATFAATPVQDNLLVAIIGSYDLKAITTPTGWNVAIKQDVNNVGTAPIQAIFYKIAGAAESKTVTIAVSSNAAIGLSIYEYSGTSTSIALDGTPGSNTGTGTAVSTGSITGKAFTNDLLVAGATIKNFNTFGAWSNGFNLRRSFQVDGPGTNDLTLQGADLLSSGTVTSTSSTASPGDVWRAQIVAFKSLSPTAVEFASLKATRNDGRVLLEWQTGYEINNLGFNIYRETDGKLTRINPEPVAGSALSFGPRVALRAGLAYSWWDNDAREGNNSRYWIEDLDLSGHKAMHGPFSVTDSVSDVKLLSEKVKSPTLEVIGKDASQIGSSAPVERLAKPGQPTAKQLAFQAASLSHPALKISVQHEGWYRISQPELVNAGFAANTDPRKLQLIVDGQEVPINVIGQQDGSLDPTDAVEFYGVGIDSAFTSNHMYYLVAGAQTGLRIPQVDSQSGSPGTITFSYAVERRDKVVYFSSLKNGGGEKFFGPLIYNAQAVDQSVTLQHVAATAGTATLDVSLQGYTSAPHSVTVMLNGIQLGTVEFNGQSKGVAQYTVAQSSLLEGNNQIQFVSPAGFDDISLVEFVRVTYQHSNTADGNAIRFPLTSGQQITIAGFTSAAVRVIDATDPNSPMELTPTIFQNGGEFSATVAVSTAGVRTLLAFGPDQKQSPAAITLNKPSSWRTPSNGANYVAVTRGDLIESFKSLIVQRRAQGLKTTLVDIEDIYDEFSFGNKTPQALRDFFAYAKTSWKIPPRFVLLAGDATYDPKNYTGVGDFDLVPTKLVETIFNETATDDWFVDFNDDNVPDMAIGRLPVRTPAEADALATKIINYDRSEACPRVVLMADQNQGHDFEAADTQLKTLIPANLTITDIRRGVIGDSNSRSQLLNAINRGAKLVNFYGHGSTLVWTNASILSAADAPNLNNTERLTLFDAMTCLNGIFHDVSIDGLGEAMLKAQGGAIAVWASTGMTDPDAQEIMNQRAIQLLFTSPGLTIGEITAQAKAVTGDPDVRRTWVLLGDPATKIK
jgi:hypothetical protein